MWTINQLKACNVIHARENREPNEEKFRKWVGESHTDKSTLSIKDGLINVVDHAFYMEHILTNE